MWPFGKNKDNEGAHAADPAAPAVEAQPTPDAAAPAGEDYTTPDPVHDAVDGEIGPYDSESVDKDDFDFSEFSRGFLDLGSVQVAMPMKSEVQVEMDHTGPKILHILTEFGRITPVAFAGRRKPGMWRETAKDLVRDMRAADYEVHIEQGPWGREIVGEQGDALLRIIGVDGPRWMLRMTLLGPKDRAQDMAQLGREVTARTFVTRGSEPILAGNSLPIALPEELSQRVREAMEQQESSQRPAPAQPQASDGWGPATPVGPHTDAPAKDS